MKAAILTTIVLCLFVIDRPVPCQQPQNLPDASIDAATRTSVIKNLTSELNDGYVFPDVARKMEADLSDRASKGEYNSITTARAFAEKLTADLQSVSHDKHLRVRFSAQAIPIRKDREEPTDEERAEFNQYNRLVNYGFERVERMQGNIGYIDLRGFNDPKEGLDT